MSCLYLPTFKPYMILYGKDKEALFDIAYLKQTPLAQEKYLKQILTCLTLSSMHTPCEGAREL